MNRQTLGYIAFTAFLLAVPMLGIYPVFAMKIMCYALFACAFNLLLGFTGLLSFGHAAFLGAAPPDRHSHAVAAVGPEEGGLGPEGIAIGVVLHDRMVVAPAVAGYFRQPFAGDAEQVGGAVGRVMHRREAVPPGALAVLEVVDIRAAAQEKKAKGAKVAITPADGTGLRSSA